MKNKKTEKRINNAFQAIVPDVYPSVLSDIKKEEREIMVEQNVANQNKQSRQNKRLAWLTGCAFLAAIIFAVIAFVPFGTSSAVFATVSLDVNPSIEICVDEKEKVIEVKPLNDEGRTVVGTMDFTGSSLEVTVNALIGSMLQNGFISEIANSVLVSVGAEDNAQAQEIQQRLAAEINTLLQTQNFSGAILSQSISADQQLVSLAETYGITTGKAQLIQKLIDGGSKATFGELAALKINELNLMSERLSNSLSGLTAIGAASDSAYIGTTAAVQVALTHAAIDGAEIRALDVEFDSKNNKLVYDVEFKHGTMEYEYYVNALTGEIVAFESEVDNDNDDDDDDDDDRIPQGTYISVEQALSAALQHAGFEQGQVSDTDVEQDTLRGKVVYEVEFKKGFYEYEYTIDAEDGSVIHYSKEIDD